MRCVAALSIAATEGPRCKRHLLHGEIVSNYVEKCNAVVSLKYDEMNNHISFSTKNNEFLFEIKVQHVLT